jgi:hypothetical protein
VGHDSALHSQQEESVVQVAHRIGAVLFILWALLHISGGFMILIALGSGDAAEAFGLYKQADGAFPPITGAVLGYLAYCFVVIGGLVGVVAAVANWRNSALGLAMNTAVAGLAEIGLAWFLVIPGYVSWAEASAGMVLFLLATVFGGIGCRKGRQ